MRCENCPFGVYDHSEDYELCPLGDDLAEENKKGEFGCKYTRKQLEKLIEKENKMQDEAREKFCGEFMEFIEKEALENNQSKETK